MGHTSVEERQRSSTETMERDVEGKVQNYKEKWVDLDG